MFALHESEDVYKALVADLAYAAVPTAVMGATIVVVGSFAWSETRDPAVFAATLLGCFASLAKLVLTILQGRRNQAGVLGLAETRWIELAHAVITAFVALSVGSLGSLLFQQSNLPLQMLGTGLIFGYCAGVVARVSIRPRIAAMAILIAVLPGIVSAALFGDPAHGIVAGVFLTFLLGGMESVAHIYRNASRRITMQLQMAALARRDPLTDLANRLGLRERFDALARPAGRLVAIHAFDLDGFKGVNDRHGHAAGDALLRAIAVRARSLSRGDDIVARIGGDEFVFVQTGLTHAREAGGLARGLHAVLTEPCRIGGTEHRIGVSLGYEVAPAEAADLDTLSGLADHASYVAKRRGGGIVEAGADRGGHEKLAGLRLLAS